MFTFYAGEEIFPMFVFLSHSWFSPDHVSSPEPNHFKLIHKVRDLKRKTKFLFGPTFASSGGIHVL